MCAFTIFKKSEKKSSETENIGPGKWREGDRIANRYEIFKILGGEGKSGMGIVFICFDHANKTTYALKTFQDKYLFSEEAQKKFTKEALLWIHMERYPYIVQAHWVEKLAGRLFIVLEYVAPDESGRNTLTHYLGKLSFIQTFKFAIQFCHGMEYAYSKGLDAHRDIKPDNIMITSNEMVKITDFGLAKTLSEFEIKVDNGSELGNKLSIFKSQGKGIYGTPPWMAPEQFDGYADKRSDIYAFGCVLYQMVSGSKFSPFIGKSLEEYEKLHKTAKVPPISSPFFPIVEKCLEKDPESRYQDFSTTREALQDLFNKETGGRIDPPAIKELEAEEHIDKGVALDSLGFYNEAIGEYRKALKIDPRLVQARINLGAALADQGHFDESIGECQEVLRIDPRYAAAHAILGTTFYKKGLLDEAISEYREALRIEPEFVVAHINLGNVLKEKGYLDEAIIELREALRIDPKFALVHAILGLALSDKGLFNEAMSEFREALRIEPGLVNGNYSLWMKMDDRVLLDEAIKKYCGVLRNDSKDKFVHCDLGNALIKKGLGDEAIREYRVALRIDPGFALAHTLLGEALVNKGDYDEGISECREALRIDPELEGAHYNLALALKNKGLLDGAIGEYREVLRIDPELEGAHYNLALTLALAGKSHLDEAISEYKEALKLDPGLALAHANLGAALVAKGHLEEAIVAYENFIKYAPPQYAGHVEKVKKIIHELKNK